MEALDLHPGELSLAAADRVLNHPVNIRLDPACIPRIEQAAEVVADVMATGRTVYGINTGFGLLANTRIDAAELQILQRSIVLSHAAGTGGFLPERTVRLLMTLKINSLARGYSGVRLEIIEALIRLLQKEVYPCIPAKGSVGASGDLAPLAHMSVVLLGEGEILYDGQRLPAREGLRIAGLDPMILAPKEGLALLNGTQVSTALAIEGLLRAENALAAATVIGALTVEAASGSRAPFDKRIHAARGHPTQIDMAAAYRQLLDNSQIEESHRDCGRVQDPYSLRCQPQVMGACLHQLRQAAAVILQEAGADRHGGGQYRAGAGRNRCCVRTSHRPADRLRSQWSTALSGGKRRRELGLHDCPGHRGGTGQRKQIAGASRFGRQPAHVRQPGGPRIHGNLRRATPHRHVREYRRHIGSRVARSLSGPRFPGPPEDV